MDVLSIGVSLLTLVAAVFLLVIVLGLRKVAEGAAIAENMSYVMGGVIALAGSVLARWANRFVVGVTEQQTRIAADLLVVLAMVLLAVYFWRVRTALSRFILSASAADLLAQAQGGDGGPDA